MVRIGAFAAGVEPVAAKETFSARNREGHYNTITNLQVFDLGTNLDHLAHILVAEHIATFHRWNNAAIDVQVRPADRAGSDLDDGVARILNLGVGDFLAADVTLAMPGQCSQDRKSTRLNSSHQIT